LQCSTHSELYGGREVGTAQVWAMSPRVTARLGLSTFSVYNAVNISGFVADPPGCRSSSPRLATSPRPLETDSKRPLRPSENLPADEGATEFEKCVVNVGATFKANAKTTEVVKPRMPKLDNPAEFAQTITVFSPTPGNHRLDAALVKSIALTLDLMLR